MDRANGRKRHKPARNSADVDSTSIDRLPPHDIEAEQGVLGCILLDSSCVTECLRTLPNSGAFYSEVHRVIYDKLVSMQGRKVPLDLITVTSELRDDGELEHVGGLSFIAGLPNLVPSAANVGHYLDIVGEHAVRRQAITSCANIIANAYESNDAEALIAELGRTTAALRHGRARVLESISIADYAAFDTRHDPTALIGFRDDGTTSRFLCRGGSAWLIGPSGVGKSSIALQLAIHAVLGLPLFGIKFRAGLRVSIMQAENDMGDVAEMIQGVLEGLGLKDDAESMRLLNDRLRIHRETTATGFAACRRLREIVEHDRSHIVIADPLLAFAGIDVSKQDQCSKFLRDGLNPVLADTGVCLIGLHHTGKPKQGNRKGEAPTLNEMLYDYLGSSELVNWARASMVLRRAGDDGLFELRITKREWRAGATHPSGQPTTSIWLRHGQRGICWEQVDPPQEAEADKPKDKPQKKWEIALALVLANGATFLPSCPQDGESLRALSSRMVAWLTSKACPKKLIIKSPRSLDEAIEKLLEDGYLKSECGRYFRGEKL